MKFIVLKFVLACILVLSIVSNSFATKPPYYYQIKIYHIKGEQQQHAVDEFLKNAYLPALHRAKISNIGVFKPIAKDTVEQLIYVFIPFKKIDDFLKLEEKLSNDFSYAEMGKNYFEATYDNAPYNRIESILMKAFDGMLKPTLPNLATAKRERVYELRSYEANTENLSINKIGMFNNAEIKIFKNLNFNAVFYGQVISGSHMPNLMYLTTFNNKADRDKHWSAFGAEYKKISGLPQYQHNVSKNTTLFLYPTDYSDF